MTLALLEWTDGSGSTIGLEIDATPSQTFELTAEVTEHPVETGAAIADHIRPGNGTIILEGLISNAPVVVPTTQMDSATRALAVITLPSGEKVSVQQWSSSFDRVRACDQLFDSLIATGTLVRLTTGLRTVENLAITRYAVAKTADTGNALQLTLEFRRVRVVTTARAAVPAVRRAQVHIERGAQPVDNRSAFARALDGGAPMTAARSNAVARRGGT